MSRIAIQLAEMVLDAIPVKRTRDERAATLTAAAALTPAPSVALEWRLGAHGGAIDVSQPLMRNQDGPELLASGAAGRSSSAWVRLGALARWWAGPEGGLVEGMWIEQDAGGQGDPSVFLHLAGPFQASVIERVLIDRLTRLEDETWRAAKTALEAADALGFQRSPLLGLMLSRTGALRLTFPNPGDRAGQLLGAIGWPGDHKRAAALVQGGGASACLGQIVVDWAPEPLPHLGVEFVFGGAGDRPAFEGLLTWFLVEGWATPQACDALRAWTGGPPPRASAWPDALVVAGLLGRPTGESWLRRRTNHLKLVLDGEGAITAKAYLGLEPYGSAS